MGDLERYFYANRGRLLHKWLHYFPIYERHLAPFRGTRPTVLEFGVFHGGSLTMWRDYFGPGARIVGVDIDPRCASLGGEQMEVVIGDQDDPAFLARLRDELGPVQVVIDDGGHRMSQQIGTFETFWPALDDGGVYLVEDLHTSYWPEYGGGPDATETFVSFAKQLIDRLHAWHAEDQVPIDGYTRSVAGMHAYDSVMVFDKAVVPAPTHRLTGDPVFALDPALEAFRLDPAPPTGG